MGPRIIEGKPWETLNSDGSPNMGSYAMQAAIGMLELAQECWRRDHPDEPIDRERVRKLAHSLLRIADRAQASVRTDGRANRMDNSHARSRGAVRSGVEAYPVPWKAENGAAQAWVSNVTDHASWLMQSAVELVDLP